jgi:type VI secretion system secreted protein VgrG
MTEEIRIESSISPLGIVRSVQLTEELDRPYTMRVRVRVEGDETIDPDAALEQNVAITISREGATARRVVGMILGVEESSEQSDEYFLTVGPALTLLGLERKSRIFQEKTVPEILEQVLGEAFGSNGRFLAVNLAATYEKREYCVQWQETTFDFVHRLMAEEGIAYGFDHSGDTEAMELRDQNQAYADLAANDGANVVFSTRQNVMASTQISEAVFELEPRLRTARTKVVVRDHDFTGPTQPEAEDGGADAQGRERESYEHGLGLTLTIGSYDEGAAKYQKQDAARQAPIRLQADIARATAFTGKSTIPAFAPGFVFELTGDPEGNDGRYLITRVQQGSPAIVGAGRITATENTFTCIPIDIVHRPRRDVFKKPKITSAELARVVGPSGEEIHPDKHGRVKVQFPWDRDGQGNEESSCWMRVAQRWAGNGWGTMHIPRIGMEVVVRYVHGDPDRPLVTGCVYNGDNAPPYGLPGEKTKSTIKSNSSLGGGGFNEFRYEDKAGSEQIYLHAQKDLDEVVLANHTTDVGGDQTNHVHNNQTQTVHGNQTEDVHGNQKMDVGAERNITVLSGFEEDIDGTESRKVKAGVTEIILGGQKREVTGAVTESILGGEDRTIVGGLTENLGSTHLRAILGGATRVNTGTFTHSASGATSLTAGGAITVVAASTFTVTGNPTMMIQAPTVFSFSNNHKWTFTTKNTTAGTKKAIFTFMFSLCAIKMVAIGAAAAAGIAKVSIFHSSLELVGASAGLTGLSLDKYSEAVVIAGVVIQFWAAKKKG